MRTNNILVSELAETFLAAKKFAGLTSAYLEFLIRQIAALVQLIGDMPVANVTPAHIAPLLANEPPRIVRNRIYIYRALFDLATPRLGIQNHLLRLTIPRIIAPSLPPPLTFQELRDLLYRLDPIGKLILIIVAYSGIRKSELLNLDLKDLAEQDGLIVSGKIVRYVPKNRALHEWLSPMENLQSNVLAVPEAVASLLKKFKSMGLDHSFPRLRQSYIENRTAETGNVDLVVQETGMAPLIARTFVSRVTKEEAERFFAITPSVLGIESWHDDIRGAITNRKAK